MLSWTAMASWRYAQVTKYYVTCGHTIFYDMTLATE